MTRWEKYAYFAVLGVCFCGKVALAVPSPDTCTTSLYGGLLYEQASSTIYLCNPSGWGTLSGGWSLNGTNIYTTNLSSNVGIGTSSPLTRLTLDSRSDGAGEQVVVLKQASSANADVVSPFNGSSDLQTGAFQYGVQPSMHSWVITKKETTDPTWVNLVTVKKSGNMGIGTTSPQAKLDVRGGVKLGTEATCDAAKEGTVRYNSTDKVLEFCDGSSWVYGSLYKQRYPDPRIGFGNSSEPNYDGNLHYISCTKTDAAAFCGLHGSVFVSMTCLDAGANIILGINYSSGTWSTDDHYRIGGPNRALSEVVCANGFNGPITDTIE